MAVAGGPNIVEDGLVLYLDAANPESYPGSGADWFNLVDSSISGSLINGPTFDSANAGSIGFDGVDDYGTLNIESGIDGNNITLNVVAKIPQNDNAALLFIFNRADYLCVGNYTGGVRGVPNGESFAMVKFNPINQTSTVRGGEYRFMDNQYHDFVFTRNNNTDIFYVDGVEVGSFPNTQTIASQLYPIEIGQRTSGAYFKQITSISYKIYNRALSPTEVFQNYNATKARYGL